MTSSKLSGALPAISGASLTGVTAAAVAAGNVTAGTLGALVVASSVPAANVGVGLLGAQVVASSHAVNSVQDNAIVGMTSSKLSGALPAISGASLTGVTAAAVAAGNVTAGTLGALVVASSVPAANIGVGDLGAQVVASSLAVSSVYSGAVTDGALPPAKIAGTAAILGANTFTGTQTLPAGTAVAAPLVMTTSGGTTLTTPAAGAVEYDGNAFYATPNASNDAVMSVVHLMALSANYTGTNGNAAQKVFNIPANGAITLAASTYFFEGQYLMSRTAGTTAHTTSVLFGGTAALNSIAYSVQASTSASAALTAVTRSIYGTAATALAVTGSVNTAAEYTIIVLRGVLRVGTAGTFIPQFQYSAAPGGTPTILAGSYFKLIPVGGNAVTNVGNWN
ncbi:MAG: hypothetical protein HY952_07410 [Elusimicrobia bacterium]|nr:hypothetical protein [Elusimicrobiota bacterium]